MSQRAAADRSGEGTVSLAEIEAAYRELLGRAPESPAVAEEHLYFRSAAALRRAIQLSDEYQDRRIAQRSRPSPTMYSGYDEHDLAIFDAFTGPPHEPVPGMITDFLGVRTSVRFGKPFAEFAGRVFGLPVPNDYFSETIEWLGLLKAVLGAGERFVMAELGAGWAPWLAAGATAARTRGIGEVRLYGVEAEPQRAAFMREHLAYNGVDMRHTHLITAAIGATTGTARWPVVEDASMHYGLRPGDAAGSREGAAERFVEVPVLGINDLLVREACWDLLHLDIQGAEVEVCAAGRRLLDERVRRLFVATHSRGLDGDMIRLLHEAGWVLEHEKPTFFVYDRRLPTPESMAVGDGAQVWRNPRLT